MKLAAIQVVGQVVDQNDNPLPGIAVEIGLVFAAQQFPGSGIPNNPCLCNGSRATSVGNGMYSAVVIVPMTADTNIPYSLLAGMAAGSTVVTGSMGGLWSMVLAGAPLSKFLGPIQNGGIVKMSPIKMNPSLQQPPVNQ